MPWRREWQPTPVFLSGEFYGQRILVVYSPWGSQWVVHIRATYTHTHTRTHTCSQLCILARGLASTATWNCQKLLNECIEEVHPSKPRYLNSNFALKVGFCLIPFLKEKSLQSYETFENITSWFLDLLFKLSLKCHECIVTWLRSFEKILFNVFALVSF